MKKTSTPPTVAEQLEQAKDGWFYEFDMNRWIHVSEVDTKEKARKFVKKRNPFRVLFVLGNPAHVVRPEYTGLARWSHKHFVSYSLTIILLWTAMAIIGGVSIHNGIERVGSPLLYFPFIMTALLCFAPHVSIAIQYRKAAVDVLADYLCFAADSLKKGFIYDVTGDMLSCCSSV